MVTQLLDLLRDNPFTALLGGIVTALSGYLVARRNTAPSVQESLNAGVAKMIEHYTQALEAGRKEIADLKVEILTLKHMTLELARTIEALADHIEELHVHIDDLTAAMLAAGLTPPSRPPARSSRGARARAEAASGCQSATVSPQDRTT